MHLKEYLLSLFDKYTPLKTLSFMHNLKDIESPEYPNYDREQRKILKELLDYSYKKSDFYRARFNACGFTRYHINDSNDFKKIPVTNKEDIITNKSKIITNNNSFFIYSAGTSGKVRLKTHIDLYSAYKKFAVYLYYLKRLGWDFDTKIIYFLPLLYKRKIVDCTNGLRQFCATFIQNKISHEFFTNREFIFYDNLDPVIDFKKLKYYVQKINSHKKKIIMGRVDFLNILVHSLKESHIEVDKPKSLINIGVLLPDVLAGRIAKYFRCPVYNIYGSSELGYIAASCAKNTELHINERTHLVEILNNESEAQTNKYGRIVVTDLINFGMPLIRYNLGDIGLIKGKKCEYCESRILEVAGRQENSISLENKNFITEKEICCEIFKNEDILQFNLIIKKNGELQLHIISNQNKKIDEGRTINDLKKLDLGKVNIKYAESFSSYYPDKLQYIHAE